MKTNKFFAFAALVCGLAMSFTSCTNDDNPVNVKQTATISFEGATLNADGYWCGNENGEKYDSWDQMPMHVLMQSRVWYSL